MTLFVISLFFIFFDKNKTVCPTLLLVGQMAMPLPHLYRTLLDKINRILQDALIAYNEVFY
jgi:hypothetical protein